MSTTVTISVEGLSRKVRALEQMGTEVTDLKDSMGRIATAVQPDYERFTPRRTGKLIANYRTGRAKGKAILYVGSARVPYAGPINFGWPARNIQPTNYVSRGDTVAAPKAIRLLEQELAHLQTKLDL